MDAVLDDRLRHARYSEDMFSERELREIEACSAFGRRRLRFHMRALGLVFVSHVALVLLLHNEGVIFLDLTYGGNGSWYMFFSLASSFLLAELLKR